MPNLLNMWNSWTRETKLFVLTVICLILMLIISTVFAYIRLDYARSYDIKTTATDAPFPKAN